MAKHVVQQGECLTSIAHAHGFGDVAKIWDHAQNRALRERRGDGNILQPGDELFVPELEQKTVDVAGGQTVQVTVKLPKRKLQLLVRNGKHEPIANADFVLLVEGREIRGKTGSDGNVTAEVPASVKRAKLTVGKLEWQLAIGSLDPVLDGPADGLSGLQGLLKSLGWLGEEVTGMMSRATRDAISAAQRWLGHDPTGEPTERLKRDLSAVQSGKKDPPKPAPPKTPIRVAMRDAIPDTPALCARKAKKDAGEPERVNPIAAGIAQLLRPRRKGSCDLCASHEDCLDNDYNFLLAVAQMAERLGGDASHFMAIMHYETAHTFSPSVRNEDSGATGLIQFMPSTAKGLGTTTAALASLCRMTQLEYVERYFQDQKRAHPKADFKKLSHVVLAVFEPAGLDEGHEVLGVSREKCVGSTPFLDTKAGEVPITPEMVDVYDDKGQGLNKDRGIVKDSAGKIIGVSLDVASYWVEHEGKKVKATPHLRAVYKGNAGLDREKTGFILRDDYAQILEKDILPKCGKASCEKAAELQESARKGNLEYVLRNPVSRG